MGTVEELILPESAKEEEEHEVTTSPFRVGAATSAALNDFNDLLSDFPEEGVHLVAGSDELAMVVALAEGAATFGTVAARVGQDLQHLHGFIEANLQTEN